MPLGIALIIIGAIIAFFLSWTLGVLCAVIGLIIVVVDHFGGIRA